MSLEVERQMVTAGERSSTVDALEGLCPSVLPVVPRQLIRPGKLPAAPIPRASVWLLACVRPDVRLEMRAFCVDLLAAREVAKVRLSAVLQNRRGRGRLVVWRHPKRRVQQAPDGIL